MENRRLKQLLESLDRLNSEDPNSELVDGKPVARELAYAGRLTGWVLKLNPQASEHLRIAARGQHVRRWTVPRDTHPRTRAGYLRWRETLKAFHAETVSGLMRASGYPDEDIRRVASLIQKKRPAGDAEQQTLEDALCLIFLQTQLAETRQKVADPVMQGVIRKTWAKMSPKAQTEALRLPMEDAQRAWLGQVLGGLA